MCAESGWGLEKTDDLPLIAIVDDDPLHRAMAFAALRGIARVVMGSSVAEAEKVMREQNPALVFLDDIMPGGETGLCFLERIKDDPELSGIPVIMVTGSDKPDEAVRGLSAGAVDYIAKPITADVIRKAVGAVLKRSAPRIALDLRDDVLRAALSDRLAALGCLVIRMRGPMDMIENGDVPVVVCDDIQTWRNAGPAAALVDVRDCLGDVKEIVRIVGLSLSSFRRSQTCG